MTRHFHTLDEAMRQRGPGEYVLRLVCAGERDEYMVCGPDEVITALTFTASGMQFVVMRAMPGSGYAEIMSAPPADEIRPATGLRPRTLRVDAEALAAGEQRNCVLFTVLCPHPAIALVTVASIDERGPFDIEGQTPACQRCLNVAIAGLVRERDSQDTPTKAGQPAGPVATSFSPSHANCEGEVAKGIEVGQQVRRDPQVSCVPSVWGIHRGEGWAAMKRYVGRREPDGKVTVWVEEGAEESKLARRLANPIGGSVIPFDWGARNHRAEQLGYAICLDALSGDHFRAHRVMGDFAWRHLATIKGNDWAIEHDVVLGWIEELERRRAAEASA
ncbi:MAG TPA: DUF6166 domain-containing protein [Terriglobales bacterium]|nr:DUF6166 domain-containing protein [Terriglobales bacterium]